MFFNGYCHFGMISLVNLAISVRHDNISKTVCAGTEHSQGSGTYHCAGADLDVAFSIRGLYISFPHYLLQEWKSTSRYFRNHLQLKMAEKDDRSCVNTFD